MKAADASELQAAIEGGELVSPYVALNQDTGEIFYDNFVPDEPEVQTMGYWGDDGEGNYTFQITETDTSYWEDNPTYIGQLASVIFHGSSTDMNITLEYSSLYEGWLLRFEDLGGESEKPEHTFYSDEEPQTWDDTGVQVAEGDSDAYILVDWNGYETFAIYSGSSAHPVSISTSDPEYPAGE